MPPRICARTGCGAPAVPGSTTCAAGPNHPVVAVDLCDYGVFCFEPAKFRAELTLTKGARVVTRGIRCCKAHLDELRDQVGLNQKTPGLKIGLAFGRIGP